MFDEIILSIIVIIMIISVRVWINIITNTNIPVGSIYEKVSPKPQQKLDSKLNDFYFIPYLNVTNSSSTLTDIEGPLFPEQMAPKCRLFGSDCVGFDTNGHLLLTKDKKPNYVNVRSQFQSSPVPVGFYQYLPNGESAFKEMCVKQFEGNLNGKKCTLSDLQLNKLVNQLNKNV